jgi:predicted  nucleic acid-binding Zn-ribbon protein
MSHAAVDLMKSIQDLEDKIEGINVVNQSQIRALETSLESAKKRANAAESKLAAIYQQNPELKRRRS